MIDEQKVNHKMLGLDKRLGSHNPLFVCPILFGMRFFWIHIEPLRDFESGQTLMSKFEWNQSW